MSVQVICGLFYRDGSFKKALDELLWSIGQNSAFWQTAVLFLDPKAEAFLRKQHKESFREVIVDRDIPERILQKPGWSLKGWWARKATELFGRILLCDFDIFVQKMPDNLLFDNLNSSPMFVDYPSYSSPNKVVGCGVTYYDTNCEWDRFMDLLLNKWHCDERAWTETLAFTRERFLSSGQHMNPYIVDYQWLLKNPEKRYNAYIIHGISPGSYGRLVLKKIGFDRKEINFNATLKEEVVYRCGNIVRWLKKLI